MEVFTYLSFNIYYDNIFFNKLIMKILLILLLIPLASYSQKRTSILSTATELGYKFVPLGNSLDLVGAFLYERYIYDTINKIRIMEGIMLYRTGDMDEDRSYQMYCSFVMTVVGGNINKRRDIREHFIYKNPQQVYDSVLVYRELFKLLNN